MTSYPAGTRARVTFVGTFDGRGRLVCDLLSLMPADVECAERVEVIEPEWQPGDVVLDADGHMLARPDVLSHFGWLWLDAPPEALSRVADAFAVRPLTLLVRDRKPLCPQVTT